MHAAPPQHELQLTEVSHPVVLRDPEQWTHPSLQCPEQTPAVHVGLAMFTVEQTVPQPPQLFGSVCSFTQAVGLLSGSPHAV